ncbi:hypothetical protein [Senegalia massiliensis]|uniref:Uncharacterized protein n=1 Tax=Senegalia massiliensis TaxID=1720316 RepID=A0A845R0M1_9CLOT|nr:hypothetical protein [Senegalia massiliensis]NBI07549.1 hypothetical protein [Senegalia massiliensis]
MKFKALINRYLSERDRAFRISTIIDVGNFINNRKNINSSKNEKEELINICSEIKEELLLLSNEYRSDISRQEINKIENLEIDSLCKCELIGNFCTKIGYKIQEQQKINILLCPLFPFSFIKINYIDGLILIISISLLIFGVNII